MDTAERIRFDAQVLREHAARLFAAAGMEHAKADVIARVLMEGELLGHDTHGLALAPRYLEEIASGSMATEGAPRVVRDTGACVTWDGLRLPGVWLVDTAMDLALARAPVHGCVTIVIRNSHHIGCLAAFLERATGQGLLALLSSSDPSQASVAPYGGTEPLFTPNPIAAGIPTGGTPILIDVSASITTNNMAARLLREGRRYPAPCLLDAGGAPTDDPGVLRQGGTILPAGGLDHGQKGYGWALIAESLTQGLSGFGRADRPRGWGASVFLQVLDPEAFGGRDAFTRQTDWLSSACAGNAPRLGVEKVRVPGAAGLQRKAAALATGLALRKPVVDDLRAWSGRLSVPFPVPLPAPVTDDCAMRPSR